MQLYVVAEVCARTKSPKETDTKGKELHRKAGSHIHIILPIIYLGHRICTNLHFFFSLFVAGGFVCLLFQESPKNSDGWRTK